MDTAPRRSGSEQRQMQATVISRLRPIERDLVRATARRRNLSVSEFVRTAILAEVRRG